ncbi:MAG TPA: HupE/UreJ family protein [Kofleriaceae bacterium]|nr:HupE/UreJ family protein [Kofleriaceae bacterium]
MRRARLVVGGVLGRIGVVARIGIVGAIVAAFVALAAFGTTRAAAHALAPSSLQLDERAPGVATARLETPEGAVLTPIWPAGCAAHPGAREIADGARVERFELTCGGRSLEGATLGLDGLAERDTIALVRVHLAGGGVVREVLGPSRSRVTLPASTPWTRVLTDHVGLGVEHLLFGLDHELFLLGLLLVVRGLRARALALTAFTAGHSLTLALATLGLVVVPPAPVEILIALTLVIVALRALDPAAPTGRDAPDAANGRSTWLLAAAFGGIHGLGFAGALAGAGLAGADLALALAAFNLGIELGQLALVVALVVAFIAATTASSRLARRLALTASPPLRTIAAHAIGAFAMMWCLERTWSALF